LPPNIQHRLRQMKLPVLPLLILPNDHSGATLAGDRVIDHSGRIRVLERNSGTPRRRGYQAEGPLRNGHHQRSLSEATVGVRPLPPARHVRIGRGLVAKPHPKIVNTLNGSLSHRSTPVIRETLEPLTEVVPELIRGKLHAALSALEIGHVGRNVAAAVPDLLRQQLGKREHLLGSHALTPGAYSMKSECRLSNPRATQQPSCRTQPREPARQPCRHRSS